MKTRSNLIATAAIAAMLLSPVAAFAQSTSDSTSGAQSGSVSGASNNNSTTNGPQTTTVAPVNNGNGDSQSRSNSNAESGSISGASATGGTSDSRSTATGGTSAATNGAATAGNAQSITFNSVTPTHTTATVRSAPTVYAPALTTTLTETCMGSSSAAGSGVGFGFSLGSTWRDKECVRRLNAREMAQTLGDREAARALLCQDDNIRKAYESVGEPCNVQATPKAAAYNTTPPQPEIAPPPVPDDSKMAPIPNPPAKPYGERGSLDKQFRTDQPDKLAAAH